MGFASVHAEYRRRWPDVVLDISFVERAVDLVEEGYDLAFRLLGDERLPAGIVARRVRPVPFRLAASRCYLERNGIPKAPEDLSRHDFITTAGGLESVSLQLAEGPIGRNPPCICFIPAASTCPSRSARSSTWPLSRVARIQSRHTWGSRRTVHVPCRKSGCAP